MGMFTDIFLHQETNTDDKIIVRVMCVHAYVASLKKCVTSLPIIVAD